MAQKKKENDTRTRRKRKNELPAQPALFYFMRLLERAEDRAMVQQFEQEESHHYVPFELVEKFMRQVRQQNIFVFVPGWSGKAESLLITKVSFAMGGVVRLYEGVSVRDEDNSFLRIYPDPRSGKIVVERLRGPDFVPKQIYAHREQCHIIRLIAHWIIDRIDWEKTRLRNLDLYKLFVRTRNEQLQRKLKELNEQRKMGHFMQRTSRVRRGDSSSAAQ